MATITKVRRKSGDAYKAVIRLRGAKPFSKTFRLMKHALAWAERMERDHEASRAYGNAAVRTMTLSELIRIDAFAALYLSVMSAGVFSLKVSRAVQRSEYAGIIIGLLHVW